MLIIIIIIIIKHFGKITMIIITVTISIFKYNSVMCFIFTPVNTVNYLPTESKSMLGYAAGNTWTVAMLEHCIHHQCVYT